MAERWLPIPGYEGRYEVSDHGAVKSLFIGRKMSLRIHEGRRMVLLTKQGSRKVFSVHVLVMAAFVGPRPEGAVTRHLDGNPLNNHLTNLAYGSQSENLRDAVAHGTHAHAKKTHCKYGHEFTPENTYIQPSRPNSRFCRTCKAARARAAQTNRKAVTLP